MRTLLFWISYPLIIGISVLPFRVLHFLSNFLFIVLFKIIKYRDKVIEDNISNSFPNKSANANRKVKIAYQRYFCDLIVEAVKGITISRSTLSKHCPFDNEAAEVFKTQYAKGNNVIVVMGHLGNWEWAGLSGSLHLPYKLNVIYHALANPLFNKLILDMRSRFGSKPVDMNTELRILFQDSDKLQANIFIADQSPPRSSAQWIKFLNQETAVFNGTEKLARKLNTPVIFSWIERKSRSKYIVKAELLCQEPATLSPGELSIMHTQALESKIRLQPECWLWSHRRWKHKPIPV